MRTVHEPEPARGSNIIDPTPKKPTKAKAQQKPPPQEMIGVPTHDEDGNPIEPSPQNDNITYIPAHHPITGQPGFMIHYPPDIHFTSFESSVNADFLMKLLRRQISWAEKEGVRVQQECDELERIKKREWEEKEVMLEAVMEAELANADREGMLARIDAKVEEAMQRDILPAKALQWPGGENPLWKRRKGRQGPAPLDGSNEMDVDEDEGDDPSPPPTGASGGFEGEGDPYDNYLNGMMARYDEQRKRAESQSMQNTPVRQGRGEVVEHRDADEADAAGALMGLSGGN